MIYILSNPTAILAARELESAFLENGIKALATSRPDYIKGDYIRFGSTAEVKPECKDLGINTPEFISLCGNKLKFSKLMIENALFSPIFHSVTDPKEFPVMIRKTLFGKGGEGIIVVEDVNDFTKNWDEKSYWTPYIPTEFEVRVHIAGGKVLRIFKKIWDNGEEEKYPVRNMAKGYHFSLRLDPEKKYPKIVKLVEELSNIPVFVNQFYALDLGWDAQEKRYFIFEANTCMGMSGNTANFYADYFIKVLDLK